MNFGNTLNDLGASVNIILLSVVERSGYVQIDPFASTLQMEAQTHRTLMGIVNDVLIEIDKFSFFVDFVILDIKALQKIPLILGRPFNKTARMLMDVDKGEVKVEIKDYEVCYMVISIR